MRSVFNFYWFIALFLLCLNAKADYKTECQSAGGQIAKWSIGEVCTCNGKQIIKPDNVKCPSNLPKNDDGFREFCLASSGNEKCRCDNDYNLNPFVETCASRSALMRASKRTPQMPLSRANTLQPTQEAMDLLKQLGIECLRQGPASENDDLAQISDRYLALMAISVAKGDPSIKGDDLVRKIVDRIPVVGYCTQALYGGLSAADVPKVREWMRDPSLINQNNLVKFMSIFGVRTEKVDAIRSAVTPEAASKVFTPGDLFAAQAMDVSNVNLRRQPTTGFAYCHSQMKETSRAGNKRTEATVTAMRAACGLNPSPSTGDHQQATSPSVVQ